jgi:flagella basal body P-ring formation protein FlgA
VFPKFLILSMLLGATITAAVVRADETTATTYSPQTVTALKTQITQEISQKLRQFNNPRIELGTIRLIQGKLPAQIKSISLQSENARGEAQFTVFGTNDESAAVLANYSAWVQVRAAGRRVTPGERLSSEEFTHQEVNVATGLAFEQRGILLSLNEDLSRLESRQSILEGQYLTASAVQRVPDVRRGDSVRIRVVSGDLNLATQGTAAEPGYTNSTIKVITVTTHRELTGILQAGGIVEVKL